MIRTKTLAAASTLALLAASGAAVAQTAPAASTPAPASTAPAATAPAAGGATTQPTGGQTGVSQGATVYDAQGGKVGTIESMQGDFAVLATDKSKVRLPKSSFANGANGPVIGMTASQIDQAAAQAGGGASTGGGATAGGTASATGSTGTAPGATASAGATGAAATPGKPNVASGAAVTDTQGGAVGTVSAVDAQFATVTLTTGSKVRLPVTAFGAGPDNGLRVAMTAAQLSAAAGASGTGAKPAASAKSSSGG